MSHRNQTSNNLQSQPWPITCHSDCEHEAAHLESEKVACIQPLAALYHNMLNLQRLPGSGAPSHARIVGPNQWEDGALSDESYAQLYG